MLQVNEVECKAFLTKLFCAMYNELPFSKQKQNKH